MRGFVHRHTHLLVPIIGAIVLAFLVFGVGYATVQVFGHYTTSVERNLEIAQRGECYRVNFLRYEVDVGRLARWQAERQQIIQIQQGLRDTSQVLRVFHLPPNSPGVKALVAVSAVQQRALIKRLKQAQKAETFLPFTNCTQAVGHPKTYMPPKPVQITLQNANSIAKDLAKPLKPPADIHPAN